jgi:hypothetical protein
LSVGGQFVAARVENQRLDVGHGQPPGALRSWAEARVSFPCAIVRKTPHPPSGPPGKAGKQHRHDAGEENAVEGPGAADRRHRCAEPAHGRVSTFLIGGADLIVIGSKRANTVRNVLGSVTAHVSRKASAPPSPCRSPFGPILRQSPTFSAASKNSSLSAPVYRFWLRKKATPPVRRFALTVRPVCLGRTGRSKGLSSIKRAYLVQPFLVRRV